MRSTRETANTVRHVIGISYRYRRRCDEDEIGTIHTAVTTVGPPTLHSEMQQRNILVHVRLTVSQSFRNRESPPP